MGVYIIAEIGINHNGSLELATQLMQAAKEARCDAVKFQKRTIEAVYTPEELAKPRESPFGRTNGDLKRQLELSVADYRTLDGVAQELGLDWSASCWDVASVGEMAAFRPKWLKIPSAMITNLPLLEAYAKTGIPVFMSTGMSTEAEVDAAILHLSQTNPETTLMLFHCHSAYPSPLEELNLRYLWTMRQKYGCSIGYSSHAVSPWPCLMAVCLGAEVVEFHLTLDRTMFGSDQAASLEPAAAKKLVEEIRTFERAAGDGVKRVWPSEEAVKAKLRR